MENPVETQKPKCMKIGEHLSHSDYYGADEDSRGITDIFCNISGSKVEVGFIRASVVGKEDKAEVCLKCANLDESVKSQYYCQNPYKEENFICENTWFMDSFICSKYVTCRHYNQVIHGHPEDGTRHYRNYKQKDFDFKSIIKEACGYCPLRKPQPKIEEKKD